MKGGWKGSVKMRVRRWSAEETFSELEQSSSSAGPLFANLKTASLSVVERIGSRERKN
jgi:hypothetical protein